MTTFMLKNVRPMGLSPVDMQIEDGRITKIQANLQTNDNMRVVNGNGYIVLPGLVNAHAHIDKNFFGLDWQPHQVPEPRRIKDYFDNERRMRRQLNLSSETQSALEVKKSIASGTTHIRTHVDIDTELGISHFEGVLRTKERFKDEMTMQTVAFPQSGMLIRQGTAELLEECIKLGADCIGGLDPSTIDRDPVKHLDIVFDIADRYGVEVDIHLHEPGMLGAFAVELIAERTEALGLQNMVTISHVFCLGMVDEPYLNQLTQLLLDNEIAIMSLGSGSGDFPPLKFLAEAGVQLCTGTDGVRDAWGPFNSVSLLDRVRLLSYRNGYRRDEDVEFIMGIATYGGATVMNDVNYGIDIGNHADLILLDADTPTEAVRLQKPPKMVIKQGNIIAEDGDYKGQNS